MPRSPVKKRAPQPAPRKAAAVEGPCCPYCKASITWENLGASEIEVTIYVREKMYYCASCGGVLGFSSWHSEG